ncbi:pseudouridine-5'-phosphate glycosidase [Thermomonospora umbrina]|uniref:Indigoidine synthase A like protein n=1 Tax=Thermomonospora umbrina TaxID=111806 RepID=A0A3D9SWV2_9ACTN|nr:pseudouridine-5'-phosphate glycosidase [Thermomonospora umbrina]REF00430.1 indigoidine synthase A like protein [Thermomonospora umbrina]
MPDLSPAPVVRPSAEVADALARGLPVVALESTIISHGLRRHVSLASGFAGFWAVTR